MQHGMDKLKILLVMLASASGGLAVSGYIFALILSPNESPLDVLSQILTRGFPSALPFLVLFSSLLFLSTLLASVVGVIYFLVLPEIKNSYSSTTSGNSRENTAMILRTLKQEERNIVNVLDVHGGTYLQKYVSRDWPVTAKDPQSNSCSFRTWNRSSRKARKYKPSDNCKMVPRGNAPVLIRSPANFLTGGDHFAKARSAGLYERVLPLGRLC